MGDVPRPIPPLLVKAIRDQRLGDLRPTPPPNIMVPEGAAWYRIGGPVHHGKVALRRLRRESRPTDSAGWVAWAVHLPLFWLPWRRRARKARLAEIVVEERERMAAVAMSGPPPTPPPTGLSPLVVVR